MSEREVVPDGRYYTVLDHMLERYDALARQLGFRAKSLEEHAAWKQALRARLRQLIGLDTMVACDPAARVTAREVMDGYIRERVLLQVEPGVIMPMYVLIPADLVEGERRPVVIAPHGHGGGGKLSVAARRDLPDLAETIQKHNYDYGVQFVRAGFVVLCPDARGFGERRELARQGMDPTLLLGGSCNLINHMAIPLGQTITGMWTWDLVRLADYVATRPDCDADRLGCGGLSGGGLQTLWFAALDDRVKAVVISGYYYGYKDSLLRLNGNCSCNYVPHLWEAADMGDIGALIAPRPLLIETGTLDGLNGQRGIANAKEQVEITAGAYALLGSSDRLVHDLFVGAHQWHGTLAIPWMKRWLQD